MWHSLRSKNIIRNQILVSKLWYIGQIYTFPKYQKGNWKRNRQFPLEYEKIQPPRHWAQLSIWRGRLDILDSHTIKLYENKMDSKFIKSHQCFLERFHAVVTKINPEFWSRPSPFLTKTDCYRSTSHKNLQKQKNKDFFIQSLYVWYISPITTSLPHIYRTKFLSSPYF